MGLSCYSISSDQCHVNLSPLLLCALVVLSSSCHFLNQEIPNGQSIKVGCYTCECNEGNLACFKACPLLNCESGSSYVPEGECCAVCVTTCAAPNGDVYQDGERWQEDGCTTCRCSSGQIFCRIKQCKEPQCDNPIIPAGECCPVCPGKSKQSHNYRNSVNCLQICKNNSVQLQKSGGCTRVYIMQLHMYSGRTFH